MKKLLMSSIVLFLFSVSILMFQISCSDDVMANTDTFESEKEIVVSVEYENTAGIVVMNIDGSDQKNS